MRLRIDIDYQVAVATTGGAITPAEAMVNATGAATTASAVESSKIALAVASGSSTITGEAPVITAGSCPAGAAAALRKRTEARREFRLDRLAKRRMK